MTKDANAGIGVGLYLAVKDSPQVDMDGAEPAVPVPFVDAFRKGEALGATVLVGAVRVRADSVRADVAQGVRRSSEFRDLRVISLDACVHVNEVLGHPASPINACLISV